MRGRLDDERHRTSAGGMACTLACALACGLWLLSSLGSPAFARGSDEELTSEYAFSPGSLVEIDLRSGGGISVIGAERSGARVTCFADGGDLDDYRIEIEEQDGGLVIETRLKHRHHHSGNAPFFEIEVPREADVEVRSAGGSIELVNLAGRFRGRTAGGELHLRDLAGDIRLETAGGQMEVIDCELDGRISTGGGEVLLENVVGDLEARSGGGEVQYKNVRTRDGEIRGPDRIGARGATPETVLISTAGGGIHVREAPAGARLRTGGGEISVRRADRFVEAMTGGGDIWVEIRDGWVEATTGAGDLEVEVLEGLGDGDEGLVLLTGLGDVTVELPKGLGLDLDVELSYTRNSHRRYEIESDIDLDIERSEEWDYDHGTARKFIWGEARVGDGRHRIEIQTTNGNVRIKTR